jgi:hypothetical protein
MCQRRVKLKQEVVAKGCMASMTALLPCTSADHAFLFLSSILSSYTQQKEGKEAHHSGACQSKNAGSKKHGIRTFLPKIPHRFLNRLYAQI